MKSEARSFTIRAAFHRFLKKKQSVLLAGSSLRGRRNSRAFNIIPKSLLCFRAKVQYGFIPTLTDNAYAVLTEIDIIQVKTDTFRHPDSGAKREREILLFFR